MLYGWNLIAGWPGLSLLLSPALKQKALRKIRADERTQRKPKQCVDDLDCFILRRYIRRFSWLFCLGEELLGYCCHQLWAVALAEEESHLALLINQVGIGRVID